MSTHGVYRFACLHDSKRELGGLICVELQSRYIEIALFTETKIYKRTFAARRCNEGNTCLSEIKAFYSSQKIRPSQAIKPGTNAFPMRSLYELSLLGHWQLAVRIHRQH